MTLPIDQIIQGNNVEVMAGWPDECIDLTVASPPYDLTNYDKDGNLITHSDKGLRDYNGYEWDFTAVAQQLYRVTKQGGVAVWVVNDATVNGSETGSSFRQALYFMGLGFSLWDTMIYQTNKPPMNDRRYQACFEYMFILSRGSPKTFNPITVKSSQGGKKRKSMTFRRTNGDMAPVHTPGRYSARRMKESIWFFGSGNGKGTLDKIAFNHPGSFPEKLAHDHIISWSNPGDVVLDCFAGSGTVPKMCVLTDRHYIGIDISESYTELSRKRVELARQQPRLFTWDLEPANQQPEVELV